MRTLRMVCGGCLWQCWDRNISLWLSSYASLEKPAWGESQKSTKTMFFLTVLFKQYLPQALLYFPHITHQWLNSLCLSFFKLKYCYWFLERKEWRGRKRNIHVGAEHQLATSCTPPIGDEAGNPGKCPEPWPVIEPATFATFQCIGWRPNNWVTLARAVGLAFIVVALVQSRYSINIAQMESVSEWIIHQERDSGEGSHRKHGVTTWLYSKAGAEVSQCQLFWLSAFHAWS